MYMLRFQKRYGHMSKHSPDWPLANAESPVPHPLKNGEVLTMHYSASQTFRQSVFLRFI